jgi:hypothetical protein
MDTYGLGYREADDLLQGIFSRSASSRACLSTGSGIFASIVVMIIQSTAPASSLEYFIFDDTLPCVIRRFISSS